MLDYEKTMKRIQAAEANKTKWNSLLEDCYDFFMPEKNTFNNKQDQGQSKTNQLFDSTAPDALSDYAARMESQLVPPGRQWMKLESGSDIPEEQETEVNQQLERMTDILFSHINSSNFSSQINECFLDLGISTGAIICEEGDGIQSSLRFRSVPLSDIIIERSVKGIIDTVYRKLKLPLSDMADIFPQAKLTQNLKQQLERSPETEIEIIEGVQLEKNKKYTTLVIYPEEKDIMYEAELDSSPWVVFRESVTPGETYGRGRAMRCLNDAKTLNKTMEFYIETCELLANPIYIAADDGIINPSTIKIRPKTVIPVGSTDSIAALPTSGAPELNIDLMNRLQDSIRRIMMSKPFGKIDETPVRTATEMSIRNADMQETAGTASGRIQTELLERIVQRSVYILMRNGKIAPFKVDGKEVKIKYTSPSAKKQDEVDLATILRYMEVMQTLPQELSMMAIKVEDVPKYIAQTMGVDMNLVRSDTERKGMQDKMEKQRQQQQQAEMASKGQ